MNQNVEPSPTVLRIPISPPINLVRRLQMERPRPVPPYSRVVEVSTCVNFSKMVSILSAGIPIPVSVTEN